MRNTMIALANIKSSRIRANFLFGLGAHLGANGMLVLTMYYLVTQISIHDARELLGWVVPVAQGCCLLGAISLAAGLSARGSPAARRPRRGSCCWLIRKILPMGSGKPRHSVEPAAPVVRKPSAAELAETLVLLKAIDWKVFKELGIAYFRERGFRALDRPSRCSGVDFLLYTMEDYRPMAVRCLPWGTRQVDVKQVRDIHRSVLLAGATKGVVLTTGVFDEEARAFAAGNELVLLGGEEFAAELLALPSEASQKLLRDAAAAERIREEGKIEKKGRKAKQTRMRGGS
jgi:hypothetical protein